MSPADRFEASAQHDGADRTVGQLFAAATADLSALVHDEIALAKSEIKKDLVRGGAGAGAGVAAALILLFSVPMFSFAAAYGLHALGLSLGWCFLIVAGAFVLLAAVAGLLAWRFFKKLAPPERTIASTKATVDVLKGAKPHPAAPLTADGHKILLP
ncbi:phage holin family protein [Streptacidiphilus cavernicola]|uniref:Phage holin family protein n=1 Tax=Streptacidiphilus cavernicola TaxID=3342716 RepID=A0ABV6VWM5_9ACTN